MPATHISRFTPSVMPAETLEGIFVQRHGLAADAVGRIREGALEGNRPHLLFVGPRGCGKTHFMALVYHRLQALPELAGSLRVAWLTEDETATSFLDLQLRVYRALSRSYPHELPLSALERVYDLEPVAATRQVCRMIEDGLGDRGGLIIVENLDQLFAEIGTKGQHEWRAYLQESGRFALLASAQQLIPAISSRTAPFFGSFATSHLAPLTAEEGRELLGRIATLHGDEELLAFLRSPRGRARVRALQHLSGGNHRVYVVLSEFLHRESLDQLIGLFEKTLDELTPYYQERLRWLSAQQRKIVEHLCAAERPVAVRDIARVLFSTNQVIASQLKSLREAGYVRASARGRESLYELTEPLMRMAMELKEHRGGPIRLVVEFLRVWYDHAELDVRLKALPAVALRERAHVEEALRRLVAGELSPCVAAVEEELRRVEQMGDVRRVGEVLEELAATRGAAEDWMRVVIAKMKSGDFAGASEAATNLLDLDGLPVEQFAATLAARGALRLAQGNRAGALEDCTRLIELKEAPAIAVASALVLRAAARTMEGDDAGAIEDYTRVVETEGLPAERIADVLFSRAEATSRRGDPEGAIEDYTRIIDLSGAPIELVARALKWRAATASERADYATASADYTRLRELPGASVATVARAFVDHGNLNARQRDLDRAIADYTRLTLEGTPSMVAAAAYTYRALARFTRGDATGAIDDCNRAAELEGSTSDQVAAALSMRGLVKASMGDATGGIEDFSLATQIDSISVASVAKIHWFRADALRWSGQLGDALRDIDESLRLRPDAEEPSLLRIRILLASGRWDDGWGAMGAFLAAFTPAVGDSASAAISEVFASSHAPSLWGERVAKLVSTFAAADGLGPLGGRLVLSLREVELGKLSAEALDAWRDSWRAAAAPHAELAVALRLFEVGLAYVRSGDPKALLDLPVEQRAVLEQLFAIEAR